MTNENALKLARLCQTIANAADDNDDVFLAAVEAKDKFLAQIKEDEAKTVWNKA